MVFFGLASVLFTYMLATLIDSDWLRNASWFVLFVILPVIVILISIWLIPRLFTWRNVSAEDRRFTDGHATAAK